VNLRLHARLHAPTGQNRVNTWANPGLPPPFVPNNYVLNLNYKQLDPRRWHLNLQRNDYPYPKPGLEPGLWAFLYSKPGPSLLQARHMGRAGPGSNGPGRAGLRALGPAQHITMNSHEQLGIITDKWNNHCFMLQKIP